MSLAEAGGRTIRPTLFSRSHSLRTLAFLEHAVFTVPDDPVELSVAKTSLALCSTRGLSYWIWSEMPICSATAPLVPEQQELLQTLAQHATVAVHLTRLAEQVRRRAVLEEPVAQARDMHSGLLQGLQAFKRTAPSFAEKLAEGSKSVCLPYLPRVGDRVGLRAPFPPARNFA